MAKIKSIYILLFCIISFHCFAGKINIVFRYDDFILKNDIVNEEVVRTFEKNHIPLVLGVIPCDSNENFLFGQKYSFLPILKSGVKNNSIEIALHGLTHQQIINGEFTGLNIIEQNRRIQKGKSFLDSVFGINTKTFIPPYNSYDDNTLQALVNNKFTIISSALCIGQSNANAKLQYAPETIEDFKELMPVLIRNKNRNGVVVVMFHDYTFRNNYSIQQLKTVLESVNKLNFVTCTTFSKLGEGSEQLDKKRIKANMESNFLSKKLHLSGVIQTTVFATKIRIVNLIGYLLLSFLFFVVTQLIFSKKKKTNMYVHLFFVLIAVIPIGLFVWFHIFSPMILVVFAVTLSVILSLLSKLKYKINK